MPQLQHLSPAHFLAITSPPPSVAATFLWCIHTAIKLSLMSLNEG